MYFEDNGKEYMEDFGEKRGKREMLSFVFTKMHEM